MLKLQGGKKRAKERRNSYYTGELHSRSKETNKKLEMLSNMQKVKPEVISPHTHTHLLIAQHKSRELKRNTKRMHSNIHT